MFDDQELIMISSLQHIVFCERQWSLIFVEQQWSDNVLTVEGKQLHEKADSNESENRPELRTVRTLRLRSLILGLTGVADIVEFHRVSRDCTFIWTPFPVEYKHGKERPDIADEVQLCAQALCLEEMLSTSVPRGAIFYGQPRRRMPVEFTNELRETVRKLCEKARDLIKSGVTPPPKFGKHCKNCSLVNECVPQIAEKSRASLYVEKLLIEMRRSLPGGFH
jgi:CRISPR-associated exonuclease Cas4